MQKSSSAKSPDQDRPTGRDSHSALREILERYHFQKSSIIVLFKLYGKILLSDIKYIIIVTGSMIITTLILYMSHVIGHADLFLALIAGVLAFFTYPICVMPWKAIFTGGLWFGKTAVQSPDHEEKPSEFVAYVQRTRSIDILNLANLSKRTNSTQRSEISFLSKIRAEVEGLDMSVQMYEYYPLEHKSSSTGDTVKITANDRKYRARYVNRPSTFAIANFIGIGMFMIGLCGAVGSAITYVNQAKTGVEAGTLQSTIYTLVLMIALLSIGVFSVIVNAWEQVAWKKFSTSESKHLLYFDATKELRDYSVTICYGSLIILLMIASMAFARAVVTENIWAELSFPEFGKIIISIFVFLTLSSAGKILGSGRSSLDKALLTVNRPGNHVVVLCAAASGNEQGDCKVVLQL